MRPIFSPERARARRADCAPGPGVFVLLPPVARSFTCKAVTPSSYRRNLPVSAPYIYIRCVYYQQKMLRCTRGHTRACVWERSVAMLYKHIHFAVNLEHNAPCT